MLLVAQSVCKLSPGSSIPGWAVSGSFFSVTRTPDELSIVCSQANVSAAVKAERNWRALKVQGQLAFSEVGILSRLAAILAAAGISIYAISTFDTDYILVKNSDLKRATEALVTKGLEVRD